MSSAVVGIVALLILLQAVTTLDSYIIVSTNSSSSSSAHRLVSHNRKTLSQMQKKQEKTGETYPPTAVAQDRTHHNTALPGTPNRLSTNEMDEDDTNAVQIRTQPSLVSSLPMQNRFMDKHSWSLSSGTTSESWISRNVNIQQQDNQQNQPAQEQAQHLYRPATTRSRPSHSIASPYFSVLGFSKCGTTFLKNWVGGQLNRSPGQQQSSLPSQQQQHNVSSRHTTASKLCVHPVEFHPFDQALNATAAVQRMTFMLQSHTNNATTLSSRSTSTTAMLLRAVPPGNYQRTAPPNSSWTNTSASRIGVFRFAEVNDINRHHKMKGTEQQHSSPEPYHPGSFYSQPQQQDEQQEAHVPRMGCGYKGPQQIRRPRELALFRDYWPTTKLIVGLRHPVWWFQSIYNYRIHTEPPGMAATIPPMAYFVAENNNSSSPTPFYFSRNCIREICLQHAYMHSYLALLGKTPRNVFQLAFATTKAVRKMPQFHQILVPPVPNPVFLYETSQLDGVQNPQVAQALRMDLSHYLSGDMEEKDDDPEINDVVEADEVGTTI